MDQDTSAQLLLLTPVRERKKKPQAADREEAEIGEREASLLIMRQSHPGQKTTQSGRARRVQPMRGSRKKKEPIDSPPRKQQQKKKKKKTAKGTKRKAAPKSSAKQKKKKVAKKKEKEKETHESLKYTKDFREFKHFKSVKQTPKLLVCKNLPVFGGLFLSTEDKTVKDCAQGKYKFPSSIEQLLEKAAHGSKENQTPLQ
jgi:hypothetical protein